LSTRRSGPPCCSDVDGVGVFVEEAKPDAVELEPDTGCQSAGRISQRPTAAYR
jgi:hypothetical protein